MKGKVEQKYPVQISQTSCTVIAWNFCQIYGFCMMEDKGKKQTEQKEKEGMNTLKQVLKEGTTRDLWELKSNTCTCTLKSGYFNLGFWIVSYENPTFGGTTVNFCSCLICCYIGRNLQGQTSLLELSIFASETEKMAQINSQCTSLQWLPIHLHQSLTCCQDDSAGLEMDRQPHHKNTRWFISSEAQ